MQTVLQQFLQSLFNPGYLSKQSARARQSEEPGIRLEDIPRETELKELKSSRLRLASATGQKSKGQQTPVHQSTKGVQVVTTPAEVASQHKATEQTATAAQQDSNENNQQDQLQPQFTEKEALAHLCLAIIQHHLSKFIADGKLPENARTLNEWEIQDITQTAADNLVEVCSSGIVASLLVNALQPGIIDERAIHFPASSSNGKAAGLEQHGSASKQEDAQDGKDNQQGTVDSNLQSASSSKTQHETPLETLLQTGSIPPSHGDLLVSSIHLQDEWFQMDDVHGQDGEAMPSSQSNVNTQQAANTADQAVDHSKAQLQPAEPSDQPPQKPALQVEVNSPTSDSHGVATALQTAEATGQSQAENGAVETKQLSRTAVWNWQLALSCAQSFGCSLPSINADLLASGNAEAIIVFIMELLARQYLQVVSLDVSPHLLDILKHDMESGSDLQFMRMQDLVKRWVEHHMQDKPIAIDSAVGGTEQSGIPARNITTQAVHGQQQEVSAKSSRQLDNQQPATQPTTTLKPPSLASLSISLQSLHQLFNCLKEQQDAAKAANKPATEAVEPESKLAFLTRSKSNTGSVEAASNQADKGARQSKSGTEQNIQENSATHTPPDTEELLAEGVVQLAKMLGSDLPLQPDWLLYGGESARSLLLLSIIHETCIQNEAELAEKRRQEEAMKLTVSPAAAAGEESAWLIVQRALQEQQARDKSKDDSDDALQPPTPTRQQAGALPKHARRFSDHLQTCPEQVETDADSAGMQQACRESGTVSPESDTVLVTADSETSGCDSSTPKEQSAAKKSKEKQHQPSKQKDTAWAQEKGEAESEEQGTQSAFGAALVAAQASSGSGVNRRARRFTPYDAPPAEDMSSRRLRKFASHQEKHSASPWEAPTPWEKSKHAFLPVQARLNATQSASEEVDSQEERLLRAWLNSLLSERGMRVSSLFDAAMCSGWPLLLACDVMSPGCVKWSKAFAPPYHSRRVPQKLMAVENGNQVCHICTTCWNLPLVNIGGIDIAEGHKGALMSLVWQLMRHHMMITLGKMYQHSNPSRKLQSWSSMQPSPSSPMTTPHLASHSSGDHSPALGMRYSWSRPELCRSIKSSNTTGDKREFSRIGPLSGPLPSSDCATPAVKGQRSQIEEEVLRWLNARLKDVRNKPMPEPSSSFLHPIPHINSLSDPAFSDGQVLLQLLLAVCPEAVDTRYILGGQTIEDAEKNARYALSVARSLGCTLHVSWQDLAEARPRALLMTLASLMSIDCALREHAGNKQVDGCSA